jgi:hypothetical protein
MRLFIDKQALYRLDPGRGCVILMARIKIFQKFQIWYAGQEQFDGLQPF